MRLRALGMTPSEAALARWSPLVNLSLVPAAGSVLADGRVLLWASNARTTFGGGGRTYSTVFNPGTNTAAERLVTETQHDMFCPGTSLLPDGRLLVAGGVDAAFTSLYNPATNTWTRGANMNIARGYNANTVLADGTVMTLGGSWSGGTAGGKTAEIYTPSPTGAGSWRVLSGVPYDPFLLDGVYNGWQTDAHAAVLPTGNGQVLMAGPSPNMAWIDTRGNGRVTPAGRRGDDQPALGAPVVMYDAGKILKVGGATWNGNVPASASAYQIDTTGATAAVRKLAPMAFPRMYANSVVLPNGQVIVVGGQTFVQEFSDNNAVLAPELWDPETETFTVLPAMAVPRNYHSLALLLPDARVLSAGGGLCGCPADKPNLQVLSPPYLFNADGSAARRPVITDAPATLGYGTTVTVRTDVPAAAFAIVRLGATTHTVNNDQRRLSLSFTRNPDGSHAVAVPSNPGLMLPGPWMLFALDAQGTPSAARIVTVSRTGTPTLENPGNQTIAPGAPVSLQVVASTSSGALSFRATGLPPGLTINTTTGLLSGAATTVGSHVVTLSASNGSQTISTDLRIDVTPQGTGSGLLAQYFAGRQPGGVPLLQRTEAPDFDWGTASPGAGVPADNFSVRWSGWIEATATGPTLLRTISDDGVRLWVDDRLVIDNWTDHAPATDTATVSLTTGQRVRVTLEHYDGGGGAVARLQWQPPGAAAPVAVPANRLYAAAPPATDNLAQGRATSQSSVFESAVASRAVDGNTNGAWAGGSVTHTQSEANPWWQVDLGGQRRVDVVQLWGRTDCCTDRLQNFTVFVASTDMTGRSLAQLEADPAVIKRQVGASRVVPGIGIPVGGLGRYVRVQLNGTNFLQLAEVQVFGGPGSYGTPTIAAVPNQTTPVGTSVGLAVSATDPDGNPLRYAASGLPDGLAISATTGRISGTPVTAGRFRVTVTASNEGGFSASTAFDWSVQAALPTVQSVAAPIQVSGQTITWSPQLSAGASVQASWNFGDGSPDTPLSATTSASHTYAAPGVYTVTLTLRTEDGRTTTYRFVQAVAAAGPTAASRSSTPLLLEPRTGASTRLWVANPDQDTVSVFDTATGARVAEVAVGANPRTLARAADGRVWVANQQAGTLSVISPSSLAVVQTVTLPRGSQPHGVVVSPVDGHVLVALSAAGRVLRLNPASGAVVSSVDVGPEVRHLALTASGHRLLASRFITPPLPGEGTATVDVAAGGGEVLQIDGATLALQRVFRLGHSDRPDNEVQGRGIPNYLGAPAIDPAGRVAWVPSKQDNLLRGPRRDGRPLDFQNTVRAISSRLDLAAGTEDPGVRLDHDNASLASAAAFHPSGVYLFVALETSRQVAVVDAARGRELFRAEAGLAPQGLAVSDDGQRLYVMNFMSRTVSVLDLAPLVLRGEIGAPAAATWNTVGTERLAANVLRGKQLFYDARDPRLARDAYMSCASCHADGGHDGRTWDLSGQGEGLRNTISLRGRAGMAHGLLHWSANFDEIQDFEGQIRGLAGGTGLMPDAAYNAGTRRQPLGDAKAGQSADLDALAAYVGSLSTFEPSPARNADGTLSATAVAGRAVFQSAGCASCHAGGTFAGAGLRDIGTVKPTSGLRLGAALTGIDVPTLRDVWRTGPYLHDGSAATLEAAVQAHRGNTVAGTDLANLVAYLRQIGADEMTAPGSTPPPANGTGLRASYFATNNLTGTVRLTRTEAVNFNWGTGSPAGTTLPRDNFSARWEGRVEAPVSGTYRFQTNSDDGVRVWIDGALVINNWTVHAPTLDTSAPITLAAGQRATVRIEYQEFAGGAVIQFLWQPPDATGFSTVPANRLYLP